MLCRQKQKLDTCKQSVVCCMHVAVHCGSPQLIVQDKGWALRVGDVRLEVGIVADCIVVRSK